MNSEIEAAVGDGNGCDNYYDKQAESDIAYCSSIGADGYTEAGICIAEALEYQLAHLIA